MPRRILSACLAIICLAGTASAQSDARNSHDHPLISRMPGTHIHKFHKSDFQEFMIATGPITDGNDLPPVEKFEGQYTSITYRADDKDLSALAVYRNFERSFSEAGFEEVFSCKSDDECGEKFVQQLYWDGDPQRQDRHGQIQPFRVFGPKFVYYYWSGKAPADDGGYVISLLVEQQTNMDRVTGIILDIGQPDELDDQQIMINLGSMTDQMETEGRVVLDGIFFDFDKSTLKPESTPALQVIAEYLNTNKGKKFFVVGHTDIKGTMDYNRTLSSARADAVVAELNKAYNVSPDQMAPVGVGPTAPRTTNATEAGRAQNRRVELVLQE